MTNRLSALGIALLLVTAGCVAPSHETPAHGTAAHGSPAQGTPTQERGVDPANGTTPGSAGGSIAVEGGRLPVDPDVVFDRVTDLMGADVPRPDAIRVIPREELNVEGGGGLSLAPAFFETVDVDVDPDEGLNVSEQANLENGRTNLGIGTVTILLGNNDSETVHYVLAHEFAHYVQGARGRGRQLRRTLGRTTDANTVFASLVEGAAVYTTNAYIDRYMAVNLTNSQLYFDLRERLAPGSYQRFVNARYIQGWRYVAWRATAPDTVDGIYANPPTTSEQVIHRLAPQEEPPRPLSVSAETGDYRRIATDRLGEAFLRIFLQNGLAPGRASRAAAGWGNDTLRTYRPAAGGKPGYAWVLRFDDAENRTEFVAATRDALDRTGNRTDAGWTRRDSWANFDLRTVGRETALLLVGTESFVTNASVGGNSGRVVLDLSGG